MGTRLAILDESGNVLFYGSKLYGHISQERAYELKSAQYLWDIKSDELMAGHGDEPGFESRRAFFVWVWYVVSADRVVKLSISELKEFIRLYDEDMKSVLGRNHTQEELEFKYGYPISDRVEASIPVNMRYHREKKRREMFKNGT